MTLTGEQSQGWRIVLQRLRGGANLRAIHTQDGASAWLTAASTLAKSDPGILAVLGRSQLSCLDKNFSRTPVRVDSSSLMAAAVVAKTLEAGQKTLMGVAPGARHLPLFLAVIGLLGDTVRDAVFERTKGAGTLIVSSDLDLRSKYATLQIDSAGIDAVHPGARLNAYGRVEHINSQLRASGARVGVCFMYPTKTLPTIVNLEFKSIIVDFRFGRESSRAYELLSWVERSFPQAGVVALYTTGDKSTEDALMRVLPSSFIFDHQAVATCEAQVDSALDPLPTPAFSAMSAEFSQTLSSLKRENEVRCVVGPDRAERLFDSLYTSLFGGSNYSDPAIRRAAWLYSVLRDFPISINYYELSAAATGKYTLKRMIAGLSQLCRDAQLGPMVQSLGVLFSEIYRELESASTREAVLLDAIESAFLSHDKRIIVLCKDATSCVAINEWLHDSFHGELGLLARVEAVAFANVWSLQDSGIGTAILSGVLPVQHRWLYGANLGLSAIHLCAASQTAALQRALELPFDPMANGRNINSRYRTLSNLFGYDIVAGGADAVLGRLQFSGLPLASASESPILASGKTDAADAARKKPSKLKSIGRGLESLAALLTDSESHSIADLTSSAVPKANVLDEDAFDHPDEPESDSSSEQRRARGIVGLRDGSRVRVLLEEEHHYEAIPHTADQGLVTLLPVELNVGDILLLSDSRSRLGLFDQMLAVIEGGGTLKSLLSYRRAWNSTLKKLREVGSRSGELDYGQLLRNLRTYGADVATEATVRNWIDGKVIGPAKASSIVAVGKLIDSQDMVQRAGEYDSAFRSIRSIHQALGRQISNILRGARVDFAAATRGQDFELSDSAALPLRELMQTVVPIEVEHVESRTDVVQLTLLHRLEPA